MQRRGATASRGGRRELVLVGGGHSHVQVLRAFAMEPPTGLRLTVVVDRPIAIYSGMVPGFLAGQYRAEELEIDVVPLARLARARVILSPAVGLDAEGRRILLADRPPIPYDVASFDIGSTVAGLDLPGVRQHALPTRPISSLVERADAFLQAAGRQVAGGALRVVVVGGGAGGVEVAFTVQHRLAVQGKAVETILLESGGRLLPGYPEGLARRVAAWARRRHVTVECGRRVAAVEPGLVRLEGGDALPFEALLWVTGAWAHPLFRESGLRTDERGFALVRSTLQLEGFENVFAVGDCATLTEFPTIPKAGVYAVRQGPYLTDNLRRWLDGRALRRYRPQGDFLTLLNLGDGRALGAKWGVSFEGTWVMTLKDRIDRRFMRRFQVLDASGAFTEAFRHGPAMAADEGEMPCGGCAAKLEQDVLARALARLPPSAPDPAVRMGIEDAEDAVAWTTAGGEVVASSVDGFRSFLDDPYLAGRVAAVNAVSDLFAKGVTPRFALAWVILPFDLDDGEREEALFQVLCGARAALDPLGVSLLGGHTGTAPELLAGLAVEGTAPRAEGLVRKRGLAPGQVLVLTKTLGTGVVLHADMAGRARGPWLQATLDALVRTNDGAARAAAPRAAAMTDVTGFGLLGHLMDMLRASGVAAVVDLEALPALPGALELLAAGVRSTLHAGNARVRSLVAGAEHLEGDPRFQLLFDPQTAGGLLFGVGAEAAAPLVEELRRAGERVAVIGRVVPPRTDGRLVEVGAAHDRGAAETLVVGLPPAAGE